MRRAPVPAGSLERVVVHGLAAAQCELVRRAERDVARGVLVEERVVEQQTRLRDRRAVRHERDFPEARSARVGLNQLPQYFDAALCPDIDDAPLLEAKREILDQLAAIAERLGRTHDAFDPLLV